MPAADGPNHLHLAYNSGIYWRVVMRMGSTILIFQGSAQERRKGFG
jgi:hypothetical protein